MNQPQHSQADVQQLAILQRISDQLAQLNASLNRPKLGFGEHPGAMFVYANRTHPPACWYTVTDGEVKPIAAASLTGYLRELRFEEVERRGKKVWKLLATLQSDRAVILECGHDAQFAKGLMSAVATLTPEMLSQPLTVVPQPGDDEAVLFCRVWLNGQPVKAQYDEATDWKAVASIAKRVVAEAAGQ